MKKYWTLFRDKWQTDIWQPFKKDIKRREFWLVLIMDLLTRLKKLTILIGNLFICLVGLYLLLNALDKVPEVEQKVVMSLVIFFINIIPLIWIFKMMIALFHGEYKKIFTNMVKMILYLLFASIITLEVDSLGSFSKRIRLILENHDVFWINVFLIFIICRIVEKFLFERAAEQINYNIFSNPFKFSVDYGKYYGLFNDKSIELEIIKEVEKDIEGEKHIRYSPYEKLILKSKYGGISRTIYRSYCDRVDHIKEAKISESKPEEIATCCQNNKDNEGKYVFNSILDFDEKNNLIKYDKKRMSQLCDESIREVYVSPFEKLWSDKDNYDYFYSTYSDDKQPIQTCGIALSEEENTQLSRL